MFVFGDPGVQNPTKNASEEIKGNGHEQKKLSWPKVPEKQKRKSPNQQKNDTTLSLDTKALRRMPKYPDCPPRIPVCQSGYNKNIGMV